MSTAVTTTWSPTNKPQLGTLVIINPDFSTKYKGVWKVTQRLQKNVVISQDGSRSVRVNPALLLPATHAPNDTVTSSFTPAHPPLVVGQIVRGCNDFWKHNGALYVVMKDNVDKVKLVKLGGDGNKYWPGVPRAWVQPVDVADILK